MYSVAITGGINALSSIISQAKYLISPVLDTAHEIPNKSGNVGLTEVETSSSGCWNAFVYINGRIDLLHTEKDCAYTFITVLQQIREKNTQLKNKLMSIFKLSEEKHILSPLCNYLSFVYNGKFVTHCHAYHPDKNEVDKTAFNISSYSNEKLFNHLRRTFHHQNNN